MLMKNPRPSGLAEIVRSITGLLVVVAVLGIAVVVGWRLLDSPFRTTQVDHSTPPVLLDLRDLAEFHAAQGQYEVTIDIEQDVRWVPGWIAGERVQFVAVGTVDAVVDFGRLTDDAFAVDALTKSVVVTLEPVRLAAPVLDLETSHVMNRDRGLLDRLGGVFADSPTTEQWLYSLAEDKIAAAADATELADRAEQNVAATVTAMLQALGFDRVEVRFRTPSTVDAVPAPAQDTAGDPAGGTLGEPIEQAAATRPGGTFAD